MSEPAEQEPAAPHEEGGGDILSGVLPANRVPVVRPDGSLSSVKEANYEKAKAMGYRFQSPEEQERFHSELKYGERPIAAGAAGAARGITLGLSDVIAPATGLVEKETLHGLEEENRGASIAGEVGGTAASLLIPGVGGYSGPALVGKLAHGVVEGVGLAGAKAIVPKLVGKALTGAIEGGIYAGAHDVTQAAIGHEELTAETILNHVGLGAGLGIGASAIIGVGGKAIGKLTGGLDKLLESKAEDYAAKAIGGIQSSFKGMEKEEIRAIARDVIDSGIIGKGERAIDILPKIKLAKKSAGEAIGKVLGDIDESAVKFNYKSTVEKLTAFKDGLNEAEKDIIGNALNKKIKQITRTAAGDGGFGAMNDLKTTMQAEINYKAGTSAKIKLMKQAVGVLTGDIDAQVKSVALPGEFEKFARAKELYGSFSEAEKWGQRGVRAMQGNRGFSLTDYLAGNMFSHVASGNIAGMAMGAAGAIGNKLVRERGPSLASKALDSLAEHLPHALPHAAQETAMGLPLVGYEANRVAIDKAHSALALKEHLADAEEELDHHMSRIARADHEERAPALVNKHAQLDDKKFQKRVDDIHAMAANPEALADRVAAHTGSLGRLHPGVAVAVAKTAGSAVAYLASKAALPPKIGPAAPEPRMTQHQKYEVAEAMEVVHDANSVLKHAAHGTLTENKINAFKAAWPKLSQHVATKALEKLSEGKATSYRSKLMLGMLAGVDPDGTVGLTASNQAAIHAGSKKPSNTEGAGSGSKAEKLTVASRWATPNQKRELRDQ